MFYQVYDNNGNLVAEGPDRDLVTKAARKSGKDKLVGEIHFPDGRTSGFFVSPVPAIMGM